MLRGSEDLHAYIKRKLGIGHLESSADGQYYYEEVECLAACDRAPCLQHNLEYHYDVTPASFDQLLESWQAAPPQPAMPAE
jgi:NADH-quinone oxidoreductase subunit E